MDFMDIQSTDNLHNICKHNNNYCFIAVFIECGKSNLICFVLTLTIRFGVCFFILFVYLLVLIVYSTVYLLNSSFSYEIMMLFIMTHCTIWKLASSKLKIDNYMYGISTNYSFGWLLSNNKEYSSVYQL